MRSLWVVVHRCAGLLIAGFLFFSGVTGAVISWDHELDEWLNPHLTNARATGAVLPPLELARRIEAHYPTMQVTGIPLTTEPGHSFGFDVEPRVDPATGMLYEDTFNQVFIDPATGEELGKRKWGAVWPVTQETFVSFLYVLHYSLHIPEFWGIDHWGVWLMGGIAMVWTIDCLVGFYLTLPARRRRIGEKAIENPVYDAAADEPVTNRRSWLQRWAPAWKVRWTGGVAKLNFDLHRAFSLWTWLLLIIIAFTAFSLNLYGEIFKPVMTMLSDITPSPFDLRRETNRHQPVAAALGFPQVIEKARAEARRRDWDEPAGEIFYARSYGIYSVVFFQPDDGQGAGGVGHRELYFDGQHGRLLGDRQPWKGTVADIFVQAQFPMHSGRILGLPGRILISLMGLVVAMLSVTGVVIWWRKRKAREAALAKAEGFSLHESRSRVGST